MRMATIFVLAGVLMGSSSFTGAAALPDYEEQLSGGGVIEGSVLKIDADELVILSEEGREFRLHMNNITQRDPDIDQGDIVEVVVTHTGLTTSVEFLRHGILAPDMGEE